MRRSKYHPVILVCMIQLKYITEEWFGNIYGIQWSMLDSIYSYFSYIYTSECDPFLSMKELYNKHLIIKFQLHNRFIKRWPYQTASGWRDSVGSIIFGASFLDFKLKKTDRHSKTSLRIKTWTNLRQRIVKCDTWKFLQKL